MSPEISYRIALLLVILITASITIYYRRKAASGEKISHREEGYLFAVICEWRESALDQHICLPARPKSMHCGVDAIACLDSLGGCCRRWSCSWLMYWTLSQLGRKSHRHSGDKEQCSLVTKGPYKWVRHPFYVTAALLMVQLP